MSLHLAYWISAGYHMHQLQPQMAESVLFERRHQNNRLSRGPACFRRVLIPNCCVSLQTLPCLMKRQNNDRGERGQAQQGYEQSSSFAYIALQDY